MSEKETGAMKAPLKADKPAKKEPKKPGKNKARIAELKSEIKKIRWPGFKQVVNNTLVVIATVLLVGVIIWLFDFLLGLLNYCQRSDNECVPFGVLAYLMSEFQLHYGLSGSAVGEYRRLALL